MIFASVTPSACRRIPKTLHILRMFGKLKRWRGIAIRFYEGPDAERVPELMAEPVAWLNEGDPAAPSYVRAAMAHFNLVSIHPWRDGNGSMSRALRTLLLDRVPS
ncbi:Fic family protein [Streptosporangium sp. CA-115845]|uniref:Fic family protein n=1 Tax=Streptosporangium sp. CA-115845 TaxID=3240071 RepID=UPI003D945111